MDELRANSIYHPTNQLIQPHFQCPSVVGFFFLYSLAAERSEKALWRGCASDSCVGLHIHIRTIAGAMALSLSPFLSPYSLSDGQQQMRIQLVAALPSKIQDN